MAVSDIWVVKYSADKEGWISADDLEKELLGRAVAAFWQQNGNIFSSFKE